MFFVLCSVSFISHYLFGSRSKAPNCNEEVTGGGIELGHVGVGTWS